MSKLWLSKLISQDPDLPGIERKINVRNTNLQAQYDQIVIDAFISYKNEEGVDVTSKYRSELQDWGLINNKELTTVLNMQTGEPVVNPEYISPEETPDVYKYEQRPSFDYFYDLITIQRADMIMLLEMHIAFDDSKGRFNF